MKLRLIVHACLVSLAASSLAQRSQADPPFPFVIPGLEIPSRDSPVDVSWLNQSPAGKDGFVRSKNGHFVDGTGNRLRFLATNFTFASAFPEHDMADKLAARLASLGINGVRIHHADNQTAPRGIWKDGSPKRNEFDPGQLDRLDYFISALKGRGIYTNLNLHVSRNYWEGEDFPDGLANSRERQERLPKYGKGLDKINAQMIRMQRDYARALLTHESPYTKCTYAKEPCVAIVEINNENTLLDLKVGSLPEYYRKDVIQQWNTWLGAQYGSTAKLAAAWGGTEELGADILPAKITTQGSQYLTLHGGAPGETHVNLLKLPEFTWHAQLHWTGIPLEEAKLYTVEFSARSDQPRRIPLSTRLNRADWHNCGLSEEAELGPEWKTFSFPFRATRVEPGAVRFDMVLGGGPEGAFSLKSLSLRRGGSLGLRPGESLEEGTVQAPQKPLPSPRGLDWTRFLAERERAYTDGMRAFLKNDLGVEANIIDTQASYGGIAGTYRESFNDFIDMHAYWQHPRFPGKPWDGGNWLIPNTPMVDSVDGGNFFRLAAYRLAGKPFTVSEYDHPAPSHYAAEMFPLIASFAAAQDWDGIFQFDWGGTDPSTGRITGYFSLQQHPAKLAFLPAAALMFRRGDVAPASGIARMKVPRTQAEPLTAQNQSIQETWKKAGIDATKLMSHRFELSFTDGETVVAESARDSRSQLQWTPEAGLFLVDAPIAKAVVGRCTGKTTRLTGLELEVASNPRNFAVLTVNAVDGKPLATSRRLLVTAAGNVENTGMGWNEDHTSVSKAWGNAPTVCEGIAAKIRFTTDAKTAKVYALDGSGNRIPGEVPSTWNKGQLHFEISSQFRTLWYEIAAD